MNNVDIINKIKEKAHLILEKYQVLLIDVERTTECDLDVFSVIIDSKDLSSIDIDIVAKINQELLDEVNDYLPDDTYLSVTTQGIERELKSDSDIFSSIGKYIYISCYQKLEEVKEKEFYGDLINADDEFIYVNAKIKQRTKEIKVNKTNIAKIRLAVKF